MRRKKTKLLKTLRAASSPKKVATYSLKYKSIGSRNLGFLKELSTSYSTSKVLNSQGDYKKYNLAIILARVNNKLSMVKKTSQVSLKEKYSFFSHFFYRKNILRSLLKINVFALRDNTDISAKSRNLNLFNYYKNLYLFKKQINNYDEYNDFSIQRIRFKPGYQVIWRRARKNLQELLNFRMLYQKKFTRALTRFYRLAHSDTTALHLLTLERAVLLSKLLPDPSTIKFFIKNKHLYINGAVPKSQKLITFTGDFIQLRVSTWLTIHLNYLNNWYEAKFIKLKSLAKLKLPTKVLETNKSFRTRATKIPANFLNFINLETTIPNSLEVDFFTNSLFIINKTNTISPIDNKNKLLAKVNIFKNYNWKYLN